MQFCLSSIFCHDFFTDSYNTGSRSQLFQTTFISTVTAFGFFRFHKGMSDFSTCSMCSGDNLTVHNNTAADTGSQCSHDQVLCTFSTAFPHLTKSCNVGIISYFYRNLIQQFFQIICQHGISPVQINCHLYFSFFYNRSRNTYTHTGNFCFLNSFFFHFFQDRFCYIRKDCFSIFFCTGFNLPFFQKYTFCCK